MHQSVWSPSDVSRSYHVSVWVVSDASPTSPDTSDVPINHSKFTLEHGFGFKYVDLFRSVRYIYKMLRYMLHSERGTGSETANNRLLHRLPTRLQ